jgi:carboxymethylenebutenolidase
VIALRHGRLWYRAAVQIDVRFACDDGFEMPGVLTLPEGATAERRPALLLMYEIFGLNDEMRRVARDLAAEGYISLIPDVFSRAIRPICVSRCMRAIARQEGQPLDDLESARRWLAARPEVDSDRLGAIGFCIGGGFALVLAMTGRYRVSAPFYGPAPDTMPRSCPVVASYGARDRQFAKEPAKLERNLESLGVPYDLKVYPEAGHSFFTRLPGGIIGKIAPYLPMHADYHEASARDAHRRIVAFFKEHLDSA